MSDVSCIQGGLYGTRLPTSDQWHARVPVSICHDDFIAPNLRRCLSRDYNANVSERSWSFRIRLLAVDSRSKIVSSHDPGRNKGSRVSEEATGTDASSHLRRLSLAPLCRVRTSRWSHSRKYLPRLT